VTLFGEFGMPHASDTAAKAAHEISRGAYRTHFWIGSILLGHVVAFALLLIGWTPAVALAGLLAIAGLYLFEYAFVLAPQEIANS
jgi:fatty acid desaturase